jgi:hypothetical protein
MAKIKTSGAAIEPRDPHAAWWTEHQRLAVEHENRYLIRGEEADEEHERQYGRLGELEGLLRNTSVTTFEGSRVQLMALSLGIEDGLEYGDLKGALTSLGGFIIDIERALERHELKEQAQRWCWEMREPSAPIWADHPGKPADATEIWRAAHPDRGEVGRRT